MTETIVLTRDNIQEIGEKDKNILVTSFYCKLSQRWINYKYKIIGSNYHNTTANYDLTLQHLNAKSKVHLYEGNKIQIYKPLVKGIIAMSPPPLPGPLVKCAMSPPPPPGPKYGGGGGGGGGGRQ